MEPAELVAPVESGQRHPTRALLLVTAELVATAATAEEVAIPELRQAPARSVQTVMVALAETAAPVVMVALARWERVLTQRAAPVVTAAYPACPVSAALQESEALEV